MHRIIKRRKDKRKIQLLNVKQVTQVVRKNGGQIFLWILGVALFVYFLISLNSFIFASPYFEVNDIEVIDKYSGNIDYPLSRIKDNRNIFKIDLTEISKNMERKYSDVQKAIVKRVLPNKLVIEVLRRRPLAQIAVFADPGQKGLKYFFSVNEDAYVLAKLGARPSRRLPVIYGVQLTADEIELGRCYRQSSLNWAVSFLNELKKNGFLKRYRVTKIDVSEPRSMSFFIDHKLEVKIGNRDWQKKVENLGSILQNMDLDYSQEYYIDLRFKDFVFGKK